MLFIKKFKFQNCFLKELITIRKQFLIVVLAQLERPILKFILFINHLLSKVKSFKTTIGHNDAASNEYETPINAIATNGLTNVNVIKRCEPIVPIIAPVTHKVLYPIKSIKNPHTGEAKALIKYTILKNIIN